MRAFAETIHCKSSAHCRQCRQLEQGRPWRGSLAKAFTLPPGAPDFACPYGKPWGHVPPPDPDVHRDRDAKKSRGLGDTVAKIIKKVSGGRVKPCGGCMKRQRFLNKLLPYPRVKRK